MSVASLAMRYNHTKAVNNDELFKIVKKSHVQKIMVEFKPSYLFLVSAGVNGRITSEFLRNLNTS